MDKYVKTKKEAREHIEKRVKNMRKHCLAGLKFLQKGETLKITTSFELDYNV